MFSLTLNFAQQLNSRRTVLLLSLLQLELERLAQALMLAGLNPTVTLLFFFKSNPSPDLSISDVSGAIRAV